MATPFVQGQLRNEYLTFKIETSCAQTGREIIIEIDSELKSTVLSEGAKPVIFIPMVDFSKLEDPSIIDAF
ncbi:MAG: hypothetical protein ACK2T7_13240 [Anaerolineales bacterium]